MVWKDWNYTKKGFVLGLGIGILFNFTPFVIFSFYMRFSLFAFPILGILFGGLFGYIYGKSEISRPWIRGGLIGFAIGILLDFTPLAILPAKIGINFLGFPTIGFLLGGIIDYYKFKNKKINKLN